MTALAALLALAAACSSSNSEVKPDGAAGMGGGAGTGGTAGSTGTGGECPPLAAYTEASHLIVNVSWPAGTASMKGDGQLHVWGKIAFTVNGINHAPVAASDSFNTPAGTAQTVLTRLASEITAILDSAETQKRFQNEGADVLHMTPEQLGRHMAAETEKWTRVVKQAGIKAE